MLGRPGSNVLEFDDLQSMDQSRGHGGVGLKRGEWPVGGIPFSLVTESVG